MTFLISAGVLVLVLIILLSKYLPIRSSVLIEGVFERKENDSDFNGNKFTVYWFENYCKDCFDNKNFENNSIYSQCLTDVPKRVWNRSAFVPEPGDSIKITAWKNIFGGIKAYQIIRTDFLETYGPKQRALREEHFRKLGEALDKRGALEKGMSVEEYRESKKEETIRYAMEKLGISREEVIEKGMHEWGHTGINNEAQKKKMTAKLGREATIKDVWEESRKRMREIASNHPDTECIGLYELDEYAKTGTLPEERLLHLNACTECSVEASIERGAWLDANTPPGPDCFSPDEIKVAHETGTLPEQRLMHANSCRKCNKVLEHSKSAYLDRLAPIPHEHCPSIVFTLNPKDIKAFYARQARMLKL